jgi:hypothetical protein
MTKMPRTLATPIAVTALAIGGVTGTAHATSASAALSVSCPICAGLQITPAVGGSFAEQPPPPPPSPGYQYPRTTTSPPSSSYTSPTSPGHPNPGATTSTPPSSFHPAGI